MRQIFMFELKDLTQDTLCSDDIIVFLCWVTFRWLYMYEVLHKREQYKNLLSRGKAVWRVSATRQRCKNWNGILSALGQDKSCNQRGSRKAVQSQLLSGLSHLQPSVQSLCVEHLMAEMAVFKLPLILAPLLSMYYVVLSAVNFQNISTPKFKCQ